ncbi:MAG: dihydroorotate dehydrogenase electron transfer subunit [Lentimicrobiaceae bacterium]|jgi:dihydroorotate dehydrogenase electron transfer subunit|nr:dihydroorotate dehydrogenase electron transfer subunit [Lentimicrobiaceae bacterium]
MAKYIQDFKVLNKEMLSGGNFRLLLQPDIPLPTIFPGQFVEAKVEDSPSTFLRRPFSVHDVDYKNNTLSLLIKSVGAGTRKLSTLVHGDNLNLVFPLGKGFSIPENKKVLLVGGGCGVAPLLFLARSLAGNHNELTITIGGKTASDVPLKEEYQKYGEVYVATEDGSLGFKGLVTHHPVFNPVSKDFTAIYTCGPEVMMRAMAKIARASNLPCEVSLENMMACGIGVCLCCVVKTNMGNQCVCTEGPVFNINNLQGW